MPVRQGTDLAPERKQLLAARERGETTYSFLQKVVGEAAAASEPETWDSHWKKMKSLNLKPARKTVAELREEAGER